LCAIRAPLELALERKAPWAIGELAVWRRRGGLDLDGGELGATAQPYALDPYTLELAGDREAAAGAWATLGCPYEAALALAEADEQEPLRLALEALQGLDARPAAAIVARRLRKRGVRGLPRGPRRPTRENPAGLTPRELEVLVLVAEGLRNAQIAERLVLSEKTVHHHVSAILRKLGVNARGQAAAEALRLGLLAQDR
jgi:DNA-binding CsgD family transcriptional regulator